MVRKVLTILSCKAGGVLKLSKAAAYAIINGKEIKGIQLQIKLERYKLNEQGNIIQEVREDGTIGSVVETIDKAFRSIEIGYIVEDKGGIDMLDGAEEIKYMLDGAEEIKLDDEGNIFNKNGSSDEKRGVRLGNQKWDEKD